MMLQRPNRFVSLALVICCLLAYDIGLRSSGSSITLAAVDQLTNAMRMEPKDTQPTDEPKNCTLPTETPTFDQYFDLVEENTPCESMKMVGGIGDDPLADGAKAICMDPKFAPREKWCVVLSFGSNNEWSFDDAMEKQGCKVYAFDPFIGQEDHTRGTQILFFNIGLSDVEKTIDHGDKKVAMNNLRGILDRFSLLGTDIDYLKIDVEGAELDFFKNVLYEDTEVLSRVKQIGMEIHHGNMDVTLRDLYWKHIHHLRCLGFRQVSSEANIIAANPFTFESRNVSHCYELVWINEAYL